MGDAVVQPNGELAKELRAKKGLTQDGLAKKTGYSKRTIENVEAGKTTNHHTLSAIATVLGVTIEKLLKPEPTADDSPSTSSPNTDDLLGDFRSFINDRTRGFVGRQFVFKAIEEFQKAQRSGYFIIEGPPGIGKSSIIAEYSKRTGCSVHFNIRSSGITSANQFLRSLCPQLHARYGIPSEPLPPSTAAHDGAFLGRILHDCANAAAAKNERLVIAVDALDEANGLANAMGGNILFLPSVLPDGVYFVVTTRRKTDLSLAVSTEQLLDLLEHANDNRRDVQEYIANAAKRPKMKKWIDGQGLAMDQFVAELAERSENNFMYLRYVLPAIEDGHYRNLTFGDLPRGLERYYEDHWQRMGMTAKPIPLQKIKMLCVLAEADMPMSRDMIASYCGEEQTVVIELLTEWSEFIREQMIDNSKCYSLYHASFRDFLRRKDVLQAAGLTTSNVRGLIIDSFSRRMPDDE